MCEEKIDRYDMVCALENGLKAALAEYEIELHKFHPSYSKSEIEEFTRNCFDGLSFRDAFSRVLRKSF